MRVEFYPFSSVLKAQSHGIWYENILPKNGRANPEIQSNSDKSNPWRADQPNKASQNKNNLKKFETNMKQTKQKESWLKR